VRVYASNCLGIFSRADSSVIKPAWNKSVTAFFMVCIPSFVEVSITELIWCVACFRIMFAIALLLNMISSPATLPFLSFVLIKFCQTTAARLSES